MNFSENEKVQADSGHPYEGKIFVHLGAVCTDQSNVQSKIVMSNPSSALLVRDNCQDLTTPVILTSNDFQFDTQNANVLIYKNVTYNIIGTVFDATFAVAETGFSYLLTYNFGTPTDSTTSPNVSRLQIYEDGRPLGPAHSILSQIQTVGLGRFSHWTDGLHFSASDNSDPRTNGRTYTFEILNLPDLVVTSIMMTPANPVAGQTVTFSATIKNIGLGPTPAGTILGVAFFIDNSPISWSDTYTASLAPGASVTLTANSGPTGSAVWTATSGSHVFRGTVDDVMRIPESNENNNDLIMTISVP